MVHAFVCTLLLMVAPQVVVMSTGKNAGPSEADLDLLPGMCERVCVCVRACVFL